jgi:hypothetical protein
VAEQEEEKRKVAKVYDNGGYPAVGLGAQETQLIGRIMVMVKCKDPEGKGWPFGYHVWFILPGEAYADLRCDCLDVKGGAGAKSAGRARAW